MHIYTLKEEEKKKKWLLGKNKNEPLLKEQVFVQLVSGFESQPKAES